MVTQPFYIAKKEAIFMIRKDECTVVPVYAMKKCRDRRSLTPLILYFGTIWSQMAYFTPRQVYPPVRILITHWIGGWVEARAALKSFWRR